MCVNLTQFRSQSRTVVVVVLTLTHTVKSVAKGQAQVRLE